MYPRTTSTALWTRSDSPLGSSRPQYTGQTPRRPSHRPPRTRHPRNHPPTHQRPPGSRPTDTAAITGIDDSLTRRTCARMAEAGQFTNDGTDSYTIPLPPVPPHLAVWRSVGEGHEDEEVAADPRSAGSVCARAAADRERPEAGAVEGAERCHRPQSACGHLRASVGTLAGP